jgi:hypothetical protein
MAPVTASPRIRGLLQAASSVLDALPPVGGLVALVGLVLYLGVPSHSRLGLLLIGTAMLFFLSPVVSIAGWLVGRLAGRRSQPVVSSRTSLRARIRARRAVRLLHLLPLIGGAVFAVGLGAHILIPATRGTSWLVTVLMTGGFSVLAYPIWALLAAGIASSFGVENETPW